MAKLQIDSIPPKKPTSHQKKIVEHQTTFIDQVLQWLMRELKNDHLLLEGVVRAFTCKAPPTNPRVTSVLLNFTRPDTLNRKPLSRLYRGYR